MAPQAAARAVGPRAGDRGLPQRRRRQARRRWSASSSALAQPDRPFHASVTELQALAAARKGDLKRARSELWTAIIKDAAAPQGAQQRAQAMLALSTARPRANRVDDPRFAYPAGRAPAAAVADRLRHRSTRRSRRWSASAIAGVLRPQASSSPTRTPAAIQVTLPAPVVERFLAAVRRLRQLRHAASGDRRLRRRWSGRPTSARARRSSRILTTPPVVAEGKVFAKDAESTVSAFDADTGRGSGA